MPTKIVDLRPSSGRDIRFASIPNRQWYMNSGKLCRKFGSQEVADDGITRNGDLSVVSDYQPVEVEIRIIRNL